jgi:hypothetical protein
MSGDLDRQEGVSMKRLGLSIVLGCSLGLLIALVHVALIALGVMGG